MPRPANGTTPPTENDCFFRPHPYGAREASIKRNLKTDPAGFTLIDILAVIASVVLLVGSQLGIALAVYANDPDNYYPPDGVNSGPNQDVYWDHLSMTHSLNQKKNLKVSPEGEGFRRIAETINQP